MIGGKRLTSFVAIALSLQIWSADAAAQVDNNPFGEAGRPSTPMRQRASDPFGGTGPFELIGEPEPTLALPEAQPQPEVLEPLEQLLRAAQADANMNKAATCKCLGENSGSIDKIKKALAGPLLTQLPQLST
jgi:hypothetical protein